MLRKDKIQLAIWLRAGATYNEVVNISPIGLVGNERFTPRAVEAYVFLWTWSAHRFEGQAGRLQNDHYRDHGMLGLHRRFDRVNRIIQCLKTQ